MDVYNWARISFQDDWKGIAASDSEPRLAHELITPFVENHDLMANFDPTL